jgi:hypothetical protein
MYSEKAIHLLQVTVKLYHLCCIIHDNTLQYADIKLTTLVVIVIYCICSVNVIASTELGSNPVPSSTKSRGRRGHDRMVVGFTTTYTISAYHH